MPSSSPLMGLMGLGYEIKLDDLLAELTIDTRSALLSAPEKISIKAVKKHVVALSPEEHKKLFLTAQMIVSGMRIEKDDLESIATQHGIPFTKTTSKDVIVFNLINKLGVTKVDALIEKALKPGEVDPKGSFGAYNAPALDIAGMDTNTFSLKLEKLLQSELPKDKGEERLVKVRIERLKDQLHVVVYYERPNEDGPEITDKKKLRIQSFKREAGSTYFRLTHSATGTVLTLRTPTQKLARTIRSALGTSLWNKADAIPDAAARAYNLAVFKNPDFSLPSVAVPGHEIKGVRVHHIEVRAATGNLLKVTAGAKEMDALADFRKLAKEARVFTKEVEVAVVDVRISYEPEGRRERVARALLHPYRIHVNEEEAHLVDAHLTAWGVADVTGG
ncbi:hypothetical protein [Corallococcus exiguus]|uniref:hypothetical protein n=1 Tax=Corallococcus exiguus TaxID=83462 RepID=UPI001493FA16|nr:hypothetical protein [Corallococcus exiguus]NPD27804.1 hypothetical protein [Corallococcus exiguus]